MKIVILDGYTENPGDLSWDELSKLGELTVYPMYPPMVRHPLLNLQWLCFWNCAIMWESTPGR